MSACAFVHRISNVRVRILDASNTEKENWEQSIYFACFSQSNLSDRDAYLFLSGWLVDASRTESFLSVSHILVEKKTYANNVAQFRLDVMRLTDFCGIGTAFGGRPELILCGPTPLTFSGFFGQHTHALTHIWAYINNWNHFSKLVEKKNT